MASYTPDQYQKLWKKRARNLSKMARKTAADAARYMEARAQAMAPHDSGTLREGIVARETKSGAWDVTSSVPGHFKYNFWVNRSAPFRSVKMVWNEHQATSYGDGSHRITGTPEYWRRATESTKKFFAKTARKRLKTVLRTRIG